MTSTCSHILYSILFFSRTYYSLLVEGSNIMENSFVLEYSTFIIGRKDVSMNGGNLKREGEKGFRLGLAFLVF